MTKEKSQNHKFIYLAFLLFLPGACERKINSAIDNYPRPEPYSHYPKTYQPYYAPYSQPYNNPYNSPPRNYYPYYDFDQYYVPTTKIKNVEQSGAGASGKF